MRSPAHAGHTSRSCWLCWRSDHNQGGLEALKSGHGPTKPTDEAAVTEGAVAQGAAVTFAPQTPAGTTPVASHRALMAVDGPSTAIEGGRWPIDPLSRPGPTNQTWSMSHRPPKSVDDVTSSTFVAGVGPLERWTMSHRLRSRRGWGKPLGEKSGGESCGCFLLLSAVGVVLPRWRYGPRVQI